MWFWRNFLNKFKENIFEEYDTSYQISHLLCCLPAITVHAFTCTELIEPKCMKKKGDRLWGGGWHTKNNVWKVAGVAMLWSDWCCIQPNWSSEEVPLPCLYAGGVSVCTGLCQLTLICLISTSKSLTSPHANKHIQSSFKPKPLSNTCLISRGPARQFIMHMKKVPCPRLAGRELIVARFLCNYSHLQQWLGTTASTADWGMCVCVSVSYYRGLLLQIRHIYYTLTLPQILCYTNQFRT